MTTPSVSSELTPSLVRTASPLAVAALAGWAAKHGIGIDNDFVTLVVGAVFGWIYYAAARFAEVCVSDKWGYVLGFKKKPVYVTPPAVVTDVTGTVTVNSADAGSPATFTDPSGEYNRVPAEELPDGDVLDSTEIVDEGAPE